MNETVFLKSQGFILDYDGNLATAEFELHDIMRIAFKLCHQNTNKNLDEFTKNELESNYKTAIKQAIAKDHPLPSNGFNKKGVFGFIDKVHYVDVDNKQISSFDGKEEVTLSVSDEELINRYMWDQSGGEVSYILVEGLIWKDRFPEECERMYSLYLDNNLYFSMECKFTGARCSVCNQEFIGQSSYCDHLRTRFMTGVSRQLMGVRFVGAARVDDPADIKAEALLVASQMGDLIDFIDDNCFDDPYICEVFAQYIIGGIDEN